MPRASSASVTPQVRPVAREFCPRAVMERAPWTVEIVSTIVGGIILALILDARKVISLDPLWNVIASVWRWLVTPVSVPLVVLLVLCLGLLGFIMRLYYAWWRSRTEPTWQTHYFTDVFFNVRWSWRFDTRNRLIPDSLGAFCPTCQGRLRALQQGHRHVETVLMCSICDFVETVPGSVSELRDQVVLRIEQRVLVGTVARGCRSTVRLAMGSGARRFGVAMRSRR